MVQAKVRVKDVVEDRLKKPGDISGIAFKKVPVLISIPILSFAKADR